MTATSPADAQWDRLIESIRRGLGIAVKAEVNASTSAVVAPEHVHEALVGAAREALRNAARHGGVDLGEVRLRVSRRRIALEVRDQGVGVSEELTPGYGIRESISRRMSDVGGSAKIVPGPNGVGTSVRLAWPASSVGLNARIGRAYELTMSSSGGAAVVNTVAYPMLVAQSAVAVHVSLAAWRSWAMPAVTCALVLATLLARRRVMRTAPTLATLVSWGLAMGVLAGLGLWAGGPGAVAGFQSFAVGFATLPLLLLAYVAPARYGPVLILPVFAAVALTTALDPKAATMDALGCFNAAVIIPIGAVAIGVLVRRSTARTEEQQSRVVGAHREARRAEYLERARSSYLRHTEERILPWLESVADGRTEAATEESRERALLLGAEARDDLYAPGVFDDELRSLVTGYRRRGGEVVVRAGVAPGASQRTSGRLLRRLVEQLPPSHRITVSAHGDSLRLVVVPALPADVRLLLATDHPGVHPSGDEFATVLVFRDLPLSGDAALALEQVGRSRDPNP